jgi:type I restriction enzyme S subunit
MQTTRSGVFGIANAIPVYIGDMELKNDWDLKKLGDICLIKGRIGFRGYTKSDLVKKGEGAITLSPSNIIENKLNFSNCSYISWPKYEESPEIQLAVGDIVFCKTASIGKTALINELPEKATLNPQFIVLKNIKCETQFLYYYLTCPSFKEKISQITTGTAVPTLSQSNFSNLPIALPPLEEQKRIVKILDEKFAQLESLKANAQTNLQNAKDLFQSQLTKAFSNTTWEKKRLGDCGTFKNGMNFAATDSGYTIRSLGVGDFKDRYSIDDTETLSEISLKAAPSEDYLLHDGDIVFVRSNGNKELVGRCLLVYPKNVPTTYSGFCIRFRKDFDLLDADFLLHFMKAESSRKILNGKEGANISNLNQKILGDFEVPLPLLPEQKLIVKELDALSEKVRQLQEIYTKQIANCDELKQALLQKAFEGEF